MGERCETRCACGRVHPRPQLRRPRRGPEFDLPAKVYEATIAGKASADRNRFTIDYAGDCSWPLTVAANDAARMFVHRLVRCRACGACLRARTNYWGFAGMEQTRLAQEAGLRTWFGTLTLTPAWQEELLDRARLGHPHPNADWWGQVECDERFRLVRNEFLREVQKYWKRLRNQGHKFKYLLVFERHKSGLPHAHFLLHECGSPILKRHLRDAWPLGFIAASLVGGRSSTAAAPTKAAWYVVKYLSKSVQARQVASAGYRPFKKRSA